MSDTSPSVIVIGAGFGGLCLAMQLKRAGFHAVTVLEKADAIGGTWRDNTYPGAACDTPSFQYCYSFEQNRDWSRRWAEQPEILSYIRRCAADNGLLPHIRLQTEVSTAQYDAQRAEWVVTATSGEVFRSQILVSAVGQLNRPYVPDIAGLTQFTGPCFHSARWRHGVDWTGKSVAVIGNGASAVQFVPRLAAQVGRLFMFQRSANWIVPKNDRAYSDREREQFRDSPLRARAYRYGIWLMWEAMFPTFRRDPVAAWLMTQYARRHLENQVRDPELRKVLRPDYPIGAKRVLISDDYYPALVQPHVSVIARNIDRVDGDAIVTVNGDRYPVDAMVFATGFQSTGFLVPMSVRGTGGQEIHDVWGEAPHAYMGLTVSGFPNLFMMYGPNTNLGHNSIIFMLECQARYIVECVRTMASRKLRSMEVRPDVMREYDDRVQRKLGRTVWAQVARSWYKTADGRITNNWYGPTWEYWLQTRRVDWTAYRTEPLHARTAVPHRSPKSISAAL